MMKMTAERTAKALQATTTAFLFLYAAAQPASVAATHICYAAAAVAWLIRLLIVRGRGLRSSPLDLPILIYLLLCAVATLNSSVPVSSWEGMRKVALICAVLVVSQNIPSLARAKQLVTILLVSGLVSVVWTLWLFGAGVGLHVVRLQPDSVWYRAGVRTDDVVLSVDGHRLETSNELLSYLRAKPPAQPLTLDDVPLNDIEVSRNEHPLAIAQGAWRPAASADQLGMVVDTARPARAFGFYAHYVTYSMVLALLASLVFGLWLGLPKRSSALGLALAAAFVLFSVALGLTLTRAAWLALIFACAVQIWFHVRLRWVRLLLPLAMLLAVLAADVASLHFRGVGLVDFRDPGTDYRVLMWKDGLRLIRENPWFGVGMNAVRDYWWRFDLAAYKKYPLRSHFHSTPIQIAVETGIPVLLSWIVLMAGYLWLLIGMVARARRQNERFAYGLALGILGGMSGFLASSLVHYDFGDSNIVFLTWLLAGIALGVWHLLAEQEELACAPAGRDVRYGLQEDLQVQPQRPVVDIG
jgi:O-Antigen ligase